jgi:hypothetical protein
MSKQMMVVANKVGGSLLAPNERYTNRMEIRSESSSRLYIVAQNKLTGEWSCSCPGWKNCRNGVRKCKHLTAMLPHLLTVDSGLKTLK